MRTLSQTATGKESTALLRVSIVVLEVFGQQIEERSPEVRVYGVQPAVEAALRESLIDVAVLIQERSSRLDVATEKGAGDERYAHHLGCGKADLRVVAVAY